MIAWHEGFSGRGHIQTARPRWGCHRHVSQPITHACCPSPAPDLLKALSVSQALEKVVADVPGCPGLVP